jgi:hypothetical protein
MMVAAPRRIKIFLALAVWSAKDFVKNPFLLG